MKLKKLVKTYWFWLAVSIFFIIFFGLLYRFTENKIFLTITMISFIYPVVLVIIGILYAWIINPIRAIKEKKRNK